MPQDKYHELESQVAIAVNATFEAKAALARSPGDGHLMEDLVALRALEQEVIKRLDRHKREHGCNA